MWFPKDIENIQDEFIIYKNENEKLMSDMTLQFMKMFDNIPGEMKNEKEEIILFKTIEI